MPRNGSGVMSLSDTISPGDPQSSTVLMGILEDIEDALTASVASDGQTSLTGPLKGADGSATAPAYAFASDTNTGIYRIGADVLGIAAGGAEIARVTTSAVVLASGKSMTVPGSLTVGGVANAHVPTGIICMWSGSVATIPTGWLLCDGTNGTPDLRDKFIIGAKEDDSGVAKTNVTGSLTQSGGSKDAIVVSHTHTGTTASNGAHTHSYTNNYGPVGASGGGSRDYADNANTQTTSSNGAHTHTFTTDSEGASGTNANLPPYYALAFIMKS